MDPQATWRDLRDAFLEEDWGRVRGLAEALIDWVSKGGFPPTIDGGDTAPAWARFVATAASKRLLDLAAAKSSGQ